jgi:hypothetical protein
MQIGNVGQEFAHRVSTATAAWEWECYSRLGPRTREVMNYALIPISAASVYQYWERRGLDDVLIAADLKRRLKELTGLSYAKCLVGKHVAKAVRRKSVVEAAQGIAFPVVAGNPVFRAGAVGGAGGRSSQGATISSG